MSYYNTKDVTRDGDKWKMSERKSFDVLYSSIAFHYTDVETFKKLRDSLGTDVAHTIALQQGIRSALRQAKGGWPGKLRTNRDSSFYGKSKTGDRVYMANINSFSRDGRVHSDGSTFQYGKYEDSAVSCCVIALPAKRRESRFAALTRSDHDECVTVYTDQVFDCPAEAARYAEEMARAEAEELADREEAYLAEQEVEDLREDVINARRECLKLIKSIKPIRTDIPKAVVATVYEKISSLRSEIKKSRDRVKELCCSFDLEI